MKTVAQIFFILFIAFLATPTIVTVIEKGCDVSVFFNMSEEENFHKEIIAAVSLEYFLDIHIISISSSTIILSEKLSKQDKIASSIFIPPPNVL